MSELEKYQPPTQIVELDLWAKRLYESGMFKDVKDVAEAFVKVTAGAELGLSPSQSMRGVHVIAGKTIIGAGLLSSLLDRPPYDFTAKYEPSIEAPTSCTITVYKNGVERGQSHFSLDDARRAGLLKSGGNWEKYPSDMLFARAVSQAARRYAAGALGGAVYVEAHGETEIQPEPSRVTATVQRMHDPVEAVEPEDVEVDTSTKALLTAMSAFDKGELYRRCAIEKGARLAAVKSSLCAAYIEWGWINVGERCPDEPDPVAVLEEFRHLDRESRPADAVEAFDHEIHTGQDLDADPQTALA